MELDTNPNKPTKCVRLIEKSDLPIVDCIYVYIYIYNYYIIDLSHINIIYHTYM